MDYSANVATELNEIFQSISKGYEWYGFSMMIVNEGIKEISQRLYETILNWITDSNQTPDSIISMFQKGGLNGFFLKKGSHNLLAFFCFSALVQRCPVLEGSWEKVIYIIKGYSKDFPQILIPGKNWINAKEEGEKWLEAVQKLCSPKHCPNPCLGLEIIRLSNLFKPVYGKFNYNENSIRELVINTICRVHDKNTTPRLTLFDLNMSIYELKKIMDDNYIDIGSIMQRDHPKSRQFEIIRAVVKITKILAYSGEPGKYVSLYFYFGGLISNGTDEKLHIQLFIKAIKDSPNLQHYVIDTYNAINYAFDLQEPNSCDDVRDVYYYAIELRDKILHMYFKHYVRNLPIEQSLREINGGITPAAQYRLKYFSDNHRSSDCKADKNYEDSTSEESDDSEYD